MTTLPRGLVGLAWVALLAGDAAAQGTPGLAGRARDVLKKHCAACHAGAAPRAGLDLFSPKALTPYVAKAPEGAELLLMVDLGHMPPGTRPKVPEADARALRDWVVGGAPPFPSDELYVLQAVLDDVRSGKAPPELSRYISFHHLRDEPGMTPDLFADALALACNLLSWSAGHVKPVAVEPTGTVFRVRLDELGWNVRPFQKSDKAGDLAPEKVNLFDLVLLEYPFAHVLEPGDLATALFDDYFAKALPLRPVAYVRGDWFVTTALQPPLYHDLLRLPLRQGPLEKKRGVEAARLRAGVDPSQVLTGSRLVESRSTPQSIWWRAADLPSSGLPALLAAAQRPPEQGGEALFNLPNGLPAFASFDDGGARRPGLPPHRLAGKAREAGGATGLGCVRCHARGPVDFKDAVAPNLDSLPEAERAVLRPLFPGQKGLETALGDDRRHFDRGVGALLHDPARDPLGPLVSAYGKHLAGLLDTAGAEDAVFRRHVQGRGAGVGRDELAALVLIARLERAVREPAGAVPVLPLDGVTHLQRQRPDPLAVTLEAVDDAGKARTVFYPGDKYFLRVRNNAAEAVYAEWYGVDSDEAVTELKGDGPPVVKVPPKGELRYPPLTAKKKFFEVDPKLLGRDRFVLYACEEPFAPGVRMSTGSEEPDRDQQHATDRFVHPFYLLDLKNRRVQPGGARGVDPARVVKISLDVEAKARP